LRETTTIALKITPCGDEVDGGWPADCLGISVFKRLPLLPARSEKH
jgi:hypothetical protein